MTKNEEGWNRAINEVLTVINRVEEQAFFVLSDYGQAASALVIDSIRQRVKELRLEEHNANSN